MSCCHCQISGFDQSAPDSTHTRVYQLHGASSALADSQTTSDSQFTKCSQATESETTEMAVVLNRIALKLDVLIEQHHMYQREHCEQIHQVLALLQDKETLGSGVRASHVSTSNESEHRMTDKGSVSFQTSVQAQSRTLDPLDVRQVLPRSKSVVSMLPVDEEKPNGWESCAYFIKSPKFELIMGIMILLSTLVTAVELQCTGQAAGQKIGYPDVASPSSLLVTVLPTLDRVFTMIFTVELLARLVVFNLNFFRVPWNILDTIIVACSLVEILGSANMGIDPKIIRLLRLAKVTRFVRLLKMDFA